MWDLLFSTLSELTDRNQNNNVPGFLFDMVTKSKRTIGEITDASCNFWSVSFYPFLTLNHTKS